MITITTIVSGANTSSRAVRRAIRDAQDFGLDYHRRRMLPFHFKASARHRYPGGAFVKRGQTNRKYRRGREKRERANAGLKNVDPKNKIPLVRTGVLQAKALGGAVKVKGRWDRREMKYIGIPFYLFISEPGQIEKIRAIKATNAPEEREIMEVTGKRFIENLDKNKSTKRG